MFEHGSYKTARRMTQYAKLTALPVSALMPLERLKARYTCGVRVDLDDSQCALLKEFEDLHVFERLRVIDAAERAGRSYIIGADLLDLTKESMTYESVLTARLAALALAPEAIIGRRE